MDKSEGQKLGARISLLGGACFVVAALAAVYVAFFMSAETKLDFLTWLGHTFRRR
jgi:hypothetical protein